MMERCRRSLNQRVQGSQGQVCVQSCACLHGGFHLPAQVGMTSWEHRANSRDPGPRPGAKGSDLDHPSTQEGP